MTFVNDKINFKYVRNYATEDNARKAVEKLNFPKTVRGAILTVDDRYVPIFFHDNNQDVLDMIHSGFMVV